MLKLEFIRRYRLLAAGGVALGCAPARVATPPTDTLLAKALQPLGRYQLTNAGELELISSAVHLGFTFGAGVPGFRRPTRRAGPQLLAINTSWTAPIRSACGWRII